MSSGNTVSFKLTASERDAVEAYRKLIREGPEALTKALAAYGRKSGQVAKDTEQGWKGSMAKMAASFGGVQAGLSVLRSAWAGILSQMQEAERRGRQVGLTFEQAGRRLAIQGGLNPGQEKAAMQQALAIGQKYGTSGEAVASAFTQLISSGGAASDVIQGGGGEALVQTAIASNLGLDAESLRGAAQSASLFLSSTGQRITPENIKRLGVGAQALFQNTNFQLSELSRFSEESGQLSMTTGASQEELLGTFALLRNQFGAAKGSTAFRAFATKLVGLNEDGPQAEALKKIGLGVGDVDFVGESYQEVLSRLTKGLQGTDAATAGQVRKMLFGEEGGAAATALLQPGVLSEIQSNVAKQQSAQSFNQALGRGTSGASAGLAKLQAEEEALLDSRGSAANAVYRQSIQNEWLKQQQQTSGLSRLQAGMRGFADPLLFDAMTAMGWEGQSAANTVSGFGFGEIGGNVNERAVNAMEGLSKQLEANTRQLQNQPTQTRAQAFEDR